VRRDTYCENRRNSYDGVVRRPWRKHLRRFGSYPTPAVNAQNLVSGPSWHMYYCKYRSSPSSMRVSAQTKCFVDSPAICPQSWTIVKTFKSTVASFDPLTVISIGLDTSLPLCVLRTLAALQLGLRFAEKLTASQRILIQHLRLTMYVYSYAGLDYRLHAAYG
jgi:hypothetical protein